MSFDARLKVPAEALEAARAAVAEAREQGLDDREDVDEAFVAEFGPEPEAPLPAPADPELEALASLGRRLRWAWIVPWMHPFLFFHGQAYVRELLRLRRAPPGNAATLLSLATAVTLWGAILVELLQLVLSTEE
jgi:hypothetical protein